MWGKDDSVDSSLSLLGCLTSIPQEEVRGYFTRNFQLDKKFISPSRCKELVVSAALLKMEKSEKLSNALRDYHKFVNSSTQTDEVPYGEQPPELKSSLDGAYWN